MHRKSAAGSCSLMITAAHNSRVRQSHRSCNVAAADVFTAVNGRKMTTPDYRTRTVRSLLVIIDARIGRNCFGQKNTTEMAPTRTAVEGGTQRAVSVVPLGTSRAAAAAAGRLGCRRGFYKT